MPGESVQASVTRAVLKLVRRFGLARLDAEGDSAPPDDPEDKSLFVLRQVTRLMYRVECPPPQPSRSHSHTHTLSHSQTLTLSHSHTLTLSLSHSPTLSHSHTLKHGRGAGK